MSGKRANIFGQGKPENPYEERDDGSDTALRATAAQMASRKIKTAKPRRPQGSSTASFSSGFGAPQQSGFNFGGVGGENNNNNPFSFIGQPSQGGNAFGAGGNSGAVTNSFPPAQSSAPSNSFANSSFPAFGNNNGGFNPQPPSSSGFNFSAASTGANNPFGASAPAPTLNGAGSGFSGSIFNMPPTQSQPAFGGLQQNSSTTGGFQFGAPNSSAPGSASTPAPTGGFQFGAVGTSAPGGESTAAPTGGFQFGNMNSSAPGSGSIAAPTGGFQFGGMNSSAPGSESIAAPTGGFQFGGMNSSAPGSGSIAAPSGGFQFGGMNSSAPRSEGTAAPTLFGTVGSSAPNNEVNTTTAPSASAFGFGSAQSNQTPATSAQNVFGGFGNNGQPTTAAPSTNLFGFGSSAPESSNATTTAPVPSLFNNFSSAPQDASAAATTTTSNSFASIPASTATSNGPFTFGSTQKAAEPATTSTTKPSLFSSVNNTTQNSASAADAPKPNLFGIPSSAPANSVTEPATANTGYNLLGIYKNNKKTAEPTSSSLAETSKPNLFAGFSAKTTTSSAETSEAPKGNPFNFSIPQQTPVKKPEPQEFKGTLFANPPPSITAAMSKSSFKTAPPPKSSIFSQKFGPSNIIDKTDPSTTESKGNTTSKEPKPFWRLSTDSAPSPAPQTQNISSSKQTLAPPSEGSQGFSRSPSPSKEQAPLSPASAMPTLTGAATLPKAAELPKIPKAHVPQEWADLNRMASNTQSVDSPVKTIIGLSARLVSLNESYREKMTSLPLMADWSSLSQWHQKEALEIKRGIDAARKQHAAAKGITGNESTLSTKRKITEETSPDQNATPLKKARGDDGATTPTPLPATETSKMFGSIMSNKNSTPAASNNLFNSKPSETKDSEPAKSTSTFTGFKLIGSVSNDAGNAKAAPTFGFIPKASSNSSGSSGGGFLSQFAKSAKTYEQLRAERKKKAKDEDFDSDDETEEEWSARWDKEEEVRKAAEDKAVKSAPSFTAPALSKETDKSCPFAPLSKAPSGASTPALFGSRVGSPAPSTVGGQSVFDTPTGTGQGSSSNIFAHLSSAPSSNNQDDESDEEETTVTSQKSPPLKRKMTESETESDDTHEGFPARKKQETVGTKGSLLSRMTKANDTEKDESEKENDSNSASLFGQANGTQTPSRVFAPFDFQGAGANTAPPKSTSFGGDQTYKEGTPIKFSASTSGQNAPLFQFQPATPSPAEFLSTTPMKPLSSNTFSFLQPNANQSGPASVAGSVLSSRAPTPLSEAESNKDSAAENDDEEGSKSEQLDLSQLTEEEKEKNEVVFHTETAIAKQQVTKSDGTKAWENFARGPLWILKDKVTGKAFVRMRISSGATPLNYALLPKLTTKVSGSSRKMVSAVRPGKDGKLTNVFYAVKNSEVAEEFSQKYNDCLPSS